MLYYKLGSLSNHEDDGSQNVAKKMNLRPFKRLFGLAQFVKCRAISPGVEFLRNFIQLQTERGKFVFVCSRLP